MAYNTNEKRVTVGEIKKNNMGEYIKVDSIEGKNGNSVDVRTYFTSEDGQILPTKKGVRVNSEQSVDLVKFIVMAMDEAARMDVLSAVQELVDGETETESDSDDYEKSEDEEIE